MKKYLLVFHFILGDGPTESSEQTVTCEPLKLSEMINQVKEKIHKSGQFTVLHQVLPLE